jgi:hypothetical protein
VPPGQGRREGVLDRLVTGGETAWRPACLKFPENPWRRTARGGPGSSGGPTPGVRCRPRGGDAPLDTPVRHSCSPQPSPPKRGRGRRATRPPRSPAAPLPRGTAAARVRTPQSGRCPPPFLRSPSCSGRPRDSEKTKELRFAVKVDNEGSRQLIRIGTDGTIPPSSCSPFRGVPRWHRPEDCRSKRTISRSPKSALAWEGIRRVNFNTAWALAASWAVYRHPPAVGGHAGFPGLRPLARKPATPLPPEGRG